MDRKDKEQGIDGQGFWFRGKRTLMRLLLHRYLGEASNRKIVNIGAGTGDDLDVLMPFGQLYVSDIDGPSVEMIPAHLCTEKRVADACALPYSDEFFDAGVAFDVLEHIEDDRKAVKELYRVLKPGAPFIFSVPAGPSLFSGHDRVLGHYRRYDTKQVKELFRQWDILMVNNWNSMLYPLAAIKRKGDRHRKDRIEPQDYPAVVGSMLAGLLKMEAHLVKAGLPLPKGLSIVGVAVKPFKAK